ncbi:hypothetical protein AVEN_13129-1 [Araneus ventricosus]|uniref:Uncharacterized protein n=1 Tax=Araneus ventricosus TaxID=182803 RepID=A0A4Y2TEC2_ARAVE|nr:hypothetical protein AVEN_13129-1 [Araneus ventricosus]
MSPQRCERWRAMFGRCLSSSLLGYLLLKLSSIASCCETQCNSIISSVVSSRLCSSTSSSISLPSTSTSSPLILAKHIISLTIDSTGYLLSQIPQCQIRQHSLDKTSSKQKRGFSW